MSTVQTTSAALGEDTSRDALQVNPPGEVDLFALVLLLRRNLPRIATFAAVFFLAMAAYTLLVKPLFSGSASLLIPPRSPSAASLAIQATTGLDLAGGGYEVYIDVLRSRRVADELAGQFHLQTHYATRDLPATERELAARTAITAAKEGLIRITVQDVDPKLAADLANAYIAELDKVNAELSITAAGQRRKYFEQEMIKEKDALADAEVALEESQEKTGVVEPQMQVQAALTATELTRAQLRARQVELGALLQGATAQNPEVERLKAEISSLEGQLHGQESAGGEAAGAPMSKVPERTLTYVRRARDVKFHEALFEMLAREYATAKEQEAKDVSMVEVLDTASLPRYKSWPPRTLYCLMALLAGAVLGFVYTLAEAFFTAMFTSPANRARWSALRNPTPASLPDSDLR